MSERLSWDVAAESKYLRHVGELKEVIARLRAELEEACSKVEASRGVIAEQLGTIARLQRLQLECNNHEHGGFDQTLKLRRARETIAALVAARGMRCPCPWCSDLAAQTAWDPRGVLG